MTENHPNLKKTLLLSALALLVLAASPVDAMESQDPAANTALDSNCDYVQTTSQPPYAEVNTDCVGGPQ
jgi:hypothetical protein